MIPEWFLLALLPPLIWASNYHIDKIAITKFGKGVPNVQLAIISGLGGLLVIASLLFLDPSRVTTSWSFHEISFTFAGGIFYLLGSYMYYLGLSKEEVTRVAPLYAFSPIFGILLGTTLLGEHINALNILGILIVVAGGILVDSRVVKHIFKVNWTVLIAIAVSCVGFSLSSVGFKQSSNYLDFGDNLMWFFVGSVATSIVLILMPKHRQDFLNLFKNHTKRKLTLVMIISNIVGNIGRSIHNYAVLLVPIAFVQTVEAFESAFVLVIAVLLGKFFVGLEPEDLSRRVLAQKLASIAVIITGSLLLMF
ncbi:MAG: EamA family transporter [Patescibacteria group bacterium]